MNHHIVLAAVVVLASACGGPGATNAGDAAAGDAAAGKARAAACVGCHQPGSFPGKSAAELVAAINAIVAGKAKHPPVGELSAEDVANIAAFYAPGAG